MKTYWTLLLLVHAGCTSGVTDVKRVASFDTRSDCETIATTQLHRPDGADFICVQGEKP
jgi:hypothetical protein